MSEPSRPIARSGRIRLWVSAWLFLLSGLLRSVGRRYRQAEAAYRAVLDRNPKNGTAWLMLGASLESQGRWQGAADV